jgi:hypothetical protein
MMMQLGMRWFGRIAAMALLVSYGIQAGAVDFDFRSLKKTIDDNRVETIEDLLPLLPYNYRSAFVLMYESRSLQTASYAFPRVILYGASNYGDRHDRLVMAYQSDSSPASNRPDVLEVFEWDPVLASYTPYEIQFQGKGRGYKLGDTSVCMHCHMNPPRPNWTAYPFWPGLYGSGTRPLDAYTYQEETAIQAKEFEEIRGVLANWKANPRTAALIKYSVPDNLDGPGLHDWAKGLSAKLGEQNLSRVSQMLYDSPEYEKYQYAIYAALRNRGCDMPSFFQPEVWERLKQGVFDYSKQIVFLNDAFASVDAVTQVSLVVNTDRWLQRSVKFDDKEAPCLAWLRLIFEGRGIGDYLQNMLGKPPIDRDVFSYDLAAFGVRISDFSEYPASYKSPINRDFDKWSCEQLAAASREATRD